MSQDKNAALALLILRLTLALFFFQWGMEKFLHPEYTASIAKYFYGMEITSWVAPLVGIVQLLLVAGLLTGLFKRLTYGIATLMHGITVAVSWRQLLDPYGPAEGVPFHHLFIASVPVLGACLALYLMRHLDTYSMSSRSRM